MGLEVVVRPFVFPNIRPGVPRVLAPPDNPEQGICVLSGGGGVSVGISRNWSASQSRPVQHHETKRQVDEERVYQMDDQGNINKSNFIDVQRLKKVRLDPVNNASVDPLKNVYAQPEPRENVEIKEPDKTIVAPAGG